MPLLGVDCSRFEQSTEKASVIAFRLLRVAIVATVLSVYTFYYTFQDTWIPTLDVDSMLVPHNDYSEVTKKEGLSACLLVNDENPRLPEWLAYHYHVLPLRSVIVAVDPVSKHQPDDILNRWPRMGVDVEIWQDHNYLQKQESGLCESKDPQVCLRKHRVRQTSFMSRCMRELKDRNKTWVLLIDVDEYISSDALDWGSNDPYDGMQLPSNAFPDFDKHETIHDILKSKREVEPCFTFTRQLYGAKEDYNHSIWIDMAPSGFDDTDFVTLKYRWRALKNKVFTNRWQKTIVDVSRIETEDLVKRPGMTVHLTVLPRYPGANHGAHCKKDPRKFRTTLLRANHYVDSYESYSYRKDARSHEKENYMRWELKSKDAMDEMDMDLTPWLRGFVKSVGMQNAKILLNETGLFGSKVI